MAGKESDGPAKLPFGVGQQQADALVALQKELLEAYEKSSNSWLARVKAEADFWSELSAKLTAVRSVPEAIETYTKAVGQRMQMVADDGRRQFEEAQTTVRKLTQSLTKGLPTGGT
jgi:hypothetical protein